MLNKDLIYKIAVQLNDESLIKISTLNRRIYNLFKNETFWRNRFISQYGEQLAEYKPDTNTWKEYYLKSRVNVEIDIRKVKNLILNKPGRYKFATLKEEEKEVINTDFSIKIINNNIVLDMNNIEICTWGLERIYVTGNNINLINGKLLVYLDDTSIVNNSNRAIVFIENADNFCLSNFNIKSFNNNIANNILISGGKDCFLKNVTSLINIPSYN